MLSQSHSSETSTNSIENMEVVSTTVGKIRNFLQHAHKNTILNTIRDPDNRLGGFMHSYEKQCTRYTKFLSKYPRGWGDSSLAEQGQFLEDFQEIYESRDEVTVDFRNYLNSFGYTMDDNFVISENQEPAEFAEPEIQSTPLQVTEIQPLHEVESIYLPFKMEFSLPLQVTNLKNIDSTLIASLRRDAGGHLKAFLGVKAEIGLYSNTQNHINLKPGIEARLTSDYYQMGIQQMVRNRQSHYFAIIGKSVKFGVGDLDLNIKFAIHRWKLESTNSHISLKGNINIEATKEILNNKSISTNFIGIGNTNLQYNYFPFLQKDSKSKPSILPVTENTIVSTPTIVSENLCENSFNDLPIHDDRSWPSNYELNASTNGYGNSIPQAASFDSSEIVTKQPGIQQSSYVAVSSDLYPSSKQAFTVWFPPAIVVLGGLFGLTIIGWMFGLNKKHPLDPNHKK